MKNVEKSDYLTVLEELFVIIDRFKNKDGKPSWEDFDTVIEGLEIVLSYVLTLLIGYFYNCLIFILVVFIVMYLVTFCQRDIYILSDVCSWLYSFFFSAADNDEEDADQAQPARQVAPGINADAARRVNMRREVEQRRLRNREEFRNRRQR